MLVLRAFRDAGCVSAGSPPSPRQAEMVVKAAVRVSSGVPPFLFPFGLSARRRAERFGRWGHPESLLEQADWGGVAGAGVRAGGAKTGSRSRSLGGAAAGRPGFRGGGLFPRRQRQFRSCRAKKQATKRRTKKDFPSPKRRRFVKTGFSARYKEARRSGRPRGRKSPGPGKGDRRGRLSRFAVKKSGRHGRLSRFACWRSPGGAVGFRTSPWRSPAAQSAFALRREEVPAAQSAFALRREEVRVARSAFALRREEVRADAVGFRASPWRSPSGAAGFGVAPKGVCNLWKPLAGDRRALSREFPTNSEPGGIRPPPPKKSDSAVRWGGCFAVKSNPQKREVFMNTSMNIHKISVDQLKPAKYNPAKT